jgi:hypothetical protein
MTQKLTTENDPRKRDLMEWLLTARELRDPSSQLKLAAKLQIDPKTLRDWKKDPVFLAEWKERSAEIVGGPDKTQEIMEALHKTATDQEDRQKVNAAKTWLAYAEQISPPKTADPLAEMSTEELKAMYAKLLGDELAARRAS